MFSICQAPMVPEVLMPLRLEFASLSVSTLMHPPRFGHQD